MSKKRQTIHIGILALTFEKILQHLLTTAFFAVDIPGIGSPDIGSTFQLSDTMMVLLNAIVFILFGLCFWGRLRGEPWHRPLLVGLALFDILAEFVFHGFFYITVSVIVSVALLVLLRLDSNKAVTK
jgi:RsiW-degrading membrane proteinase PrsW (M82 family)